jgi:hypothetical protein
VEGMVKEINSKEELHKAIWDNICRKQFYLAEESLIWSGLVRGAFGYNSITPTTKAILEGTYNYLPEFDEATKEILQECTFIRLQVPETLSQRLSPQWTGPTISARLGKKCPC